MMITVINKPQVEYHSPGWIPIERKDRLFDENICVIEKDSIFVYPARSMTYMKSSIKTKKKLSRLRGKMSKQSEKEIDDRILDLRSEWERNI